MKIANTLSRPNKYTNPFLKTPIKMEIILGKFINFHKEKKNSKFTAPKEEKKIIKDSSIPNKEKENQQEPCNKNINLQNWIENRKKWLQVKKKKKRKKTEKKMLFFKKIEK